MSKFTRVVLVLGLLLNMVVAGVARARPQTDAWTLYGPSNEPFNAAHWQVNDLDLTFGLHGAVILGTDDGVLTMQGGTDQWSQRVLAGEAISDVAVENSESENVYAALEDGGYSRGPAYSDTWPAQPLHTDLDIRALTPGPFGGVIAAVDGGVLFLTNGTKEPVGTTGLTDGDVQDVRVAKEHVWVATPSGVFKSPVDNLGTWTSTEVTDPVTSLTSNFSKVYAAGAEGIYVTADGADWTERGRIHSVNDLAAGSNVANSTIYAATAAGVWRSTNDGILWTNYNDDLSFGAVTSVNAVEADPHGWGVGIATGGSGYWDRVFDIVAYPPVFTKPGALVKNKVFPVAWTTDDPDGSGVAHSDISYTRAGPTGAFGAPVLWRDNATALSGNFTGAPGNTYCFTGTSTDNVGNVSYPSGARCTNVPLNDTQMGVARGPWTRFRSTGTYLNDASRATRKGATLSKSVENASYFVVASTKCRGCGTLRVLFNNVLIETINLSASRTVKKSFIATAPLAAPGAGVVKLVVSSSRKPVIVEGLAVVRAP